jgi:uncharacterized membrane protein YczE
VNKADPRPNADGQPTRNAGRRPAKRTDLATLPVRHQPGRRLTQLAVGLLGYGLTAALVVRSHLGSLPWDVFHQGLSRQTGVPLGAVSIAVGAAVLLLWIPLRQRPGVGTVGNVVLVGTSLGLGVAVLPAPTGLAMRVAYLGAGIVLNAMATALYVGARLGPGPRDGLMTGLAARGVSIRLARTGIEVVVVAAGFAMGGVLGVGTLAYALVIGPLVQLMLPWFAVRGPAGTQPVAPAPVAGTQPASAPVTGGGVA